MITPVARAHPIPAGTAILAALALSLALIIQPATASAGTARTALGSSARGHILALARAEMARNDLHAAILSVRQGSRTIVTSALGTSMTGVPATTGMHFRIGSVAFAYLSTLLLRLRDQGQLSLSGRHRLRRAAVPALLPGADRADLTARPRRLLRHGTVHR